MNTERNCDSLPFKVSVGVVAHNEERNIKSLLEALLQQKGGKDLIEEILVVSSGSTDATNDIVRGYEDRGVRLLVQEQREGKAAAINLFLANATQEILVIQSADTLPLTDTIERLVLPFRDSSVGMTGAHPIPTSQDSTLTALGVSLMWQMHHQRNCEHLSFPKFGELIAFRKVFSKIPEQIVVDEAEIESIIEETQLRRVYCPDAVVLNDGPTSVRELFSQRYKIHMGNADLFRRRRYRPLTGSGFYLISLGVRLTAMEPKKLAALALMSAIEISSKVCARYAFARNPIPPYRWKLVKSGKHPCLRIYSTRHRG